MYTMFLEKKVFTNNFSHGYMLYRGWRPLLVVRLKLKDSGILLDSLEIAAPLFMPPRAAGRFALAKNHYCLDGQCESCKDCTNVNL